MIIDKKIWAVEQNNLYTVINEIKIQLDKGINSAGNYKKEAIAIQKEMWKESTCMHTNGLDAAVEAWQYQVDISSHALKYKFSYSIVHRLEKMYQSPYFGRIDFIEEGEENVEQIYIGIYNLSASNTTDILVYDWRSPISSMFYDYEIGPCHFNCPAGLIHGQMSLKRQYKIENQNISYMFDSSLRINDDMLQEILGKNTDSRMKTIVTSIQREQNSIIRDDTHKVLIVQGSAGSGKTSIALHRAAYLLYKYRETIKPENILILSPNHVFEDYISNVLPELGEENVERSTFADFFGRLLDEKYTVETSNEQMEYILSGCLDEPRIKCIKFKSSLSFLSILKRYIQYLENGGGIEFKDLIYDGQLIISSNDIYALFKSYCAPISLSKRLQKLCIRLLFLLEPHVEARTKTILENDLSEETDLSVHEKKFVLSQKVKLEFESIKKGIAQMTSFDINMMYMNLFRNIDLFNEPLNKMEYENLSDISIYTLRHLQNNSINYEDIAPLLFLKTALDTTISHTKSIKHVIIDEAQDYTAVQYEIFKKTFERCSMTILGDLNQSVNAYMNVGSFDIISDIFPKKDTLSIALTKSYRSTKEIDDFCKEFLINQNTSEHLKRHGCKPSILKVDRINLPREIADNIIKLKNKGYKLIAVICKTAIECESLYKSILSYVDISLISNQQELYQGGVVILPSYLSKGLEFDAVIISSIENEDFSIEEDRKLLYTVCTRALHELTLYYFDNLSRFIKETNRDLYTTNL